MEVNKIYAEDCFDTMRHMVSEGQRVDVILTSPPYCTPNDDARKYSASRFDNYMTHYDVFEGFSSPEEYRDWTVRLFNAYDSVLNTNGVVLYNISYTVKFPDLVYQVLYDVITNTNFSIVDCISWKKNNALPQNMNPNRLTRICEFVFVFVRKTETATFKTNKQPISGGRYRNLFFNYIEAPNNDILDKTLNRLNSATFSTKFVRALLNIYANENSVVYDSFMGTGTTAVACKQFGCSYIGSELSDEQCRLAELRLNSTADLKKVNAKKLF